MVRIFENVLGRYKVIDLGERTDDLASIELFADNPPTMAIMALSLAGNLAWATNLS